MQLSFLGQTYQAASPTISAIATGETATFLGKPYARKQFTVSSHGRSTTELIYRGIRYSA